MIKKIYDKEILLALIISSKYNPDKTTFITDGKQILQTGYIVYPAGYKIDPHIHKPFLRKTSGTQEFLYIKKGQVRVNFYSETKEYIESYNLEEEDSILLLSGGHGFDMIKDSIMIEVKNGPFAGDQDKDRFNVGEKKIDTS